MDGPKESLVLEKVNGGSLLRRVPGAEGREDTVRDEMPCGLEFCTRTSGWTLLSNPVSICAVMCFELLKMHGLWGEAATLNGSS